MLIRWLLAGLLGCLLAPIGAASNPAPEGATYNTLARLLDDCIEQQFETDSLPDAFAVIDLETACPDLSVVLGKHTPLMTAVIADLRTGSLSELADLRFFARSFNQATNISTRLDPSGLAALLENILDEHKATAKPSWWERFIGWLNNRRASDTEPADMDWLKRLLENFSLSAEVAQFIVYIAAFVIIALALALIVNELRRSTLSHRLTRRWQASNNNTITPETPQQASGIQTKDLPHHLPALLGYCIRYLCVQQRLPDKKSLTNREILLYLSAQKDSAAVCFEHLYAQAERVIYGDQQLEKHAIEQCHKEALTLINSTVTRA